MDKPFRFLAKHEARDWGVKVTVPTEKQCIEPHSPTFQEILHLPSPLVAPESRFHAARSPKRYGGISPAKSSANRVISEMRPDTGGLGISAKRVPSAGDVVPPTSVEKTPFVSIPEKTYYTFSKGDKHVSKALSEIGRGSFSVVYLAVDEKGNDVAVKDTMYPLEDSNLRSRVESSAVREIELLSKISHPNVIELLSCRVEQQQVVMVMPYCEGGDLYDFMSHYKPHITSEKTRKIFSDIVAAVQHLHSRNIVHRDIKLENVLLKCSPQRICSMSDESMKTSPLVVLSDLGLAREIDPENPLLTTRCGSEDYVSPELLMGVPYDGRQSDVWALGVLLYGLMEGKLPFDPNQRNQHVSAVRRARMKPTHKIALIDWSWETIAEDSKKDDNWHMAKRIVESCLVKKDKRTAIFDVYNSEWCAKYTRHDHAGASMQGVLN